MIQLNFPENDKCKNAFLAVCCSTNESANVKFINKNAKWGGRFGPGNSVLHSLLNKWKIMRIHAVFHDAFGYLKSTYGLTSGYLYVCPNIRIIPNCMLLGHITGVIYWILFAIIRRDDYKRIPF